MLFLEILIVLLYGMALLKRDRMTVPFNIENRIDRSKWFLRCDEFDCNFWKSCTSHL